MRAFFVFVVVEHFGSRSAPLLDKPMLRQLDLEAGSEVEISLRDNSMVITPYRVLGVDDAKAIGRRLAEKRRKALERLAK